MADGIYASGQWRVAEGKVDEYLRRWEAWIDWTAENLPGFRYARLLRSQDDPMRFTSISEWDDQDSLNAWKSSPGFREKLAEVRELCDEFVGGDFDVAVAVLAPASTRS